ncbi:MAG: PEP-CTERM sorting domain-containing protein [Phycisphaeraceae bacterium]|nr:PEP-CTERM sorting domain-containing protein [Phycisphaeraceae bacterium]
MRAFMTLGAVVAIAGLASAQVWDEVGDAGENGIGDAQITVGVGALTEIRGFGEAFGADVYQIRITDIAGFSASTIGGASYDTQLFLFAADGSGITENDDASGLQSLINNQGLIGSGAAPGIYYLAISSFNRDPRDADGLAMFGFTSWPGERADQRQPTSSNPFVSWSDSGGGSGDYTIFLTGAEYAVPAPASLALLGLGGLAALRRRR